jgi:glycosyltransferase involved in cell wall biosynthesis
MPLVLQALGLQISPPPRGVPKGGSEALKALSCLHMVVGARAKPRIVLSGVNFVEGGPLSVFKDALQELADHYASRYEIVALVHRQGLFDIDSVTYIEFPHVKSSWLRRLHFEYWSLRALSRRLRPFLWLSMHDMTPNVTAEVRAVYCHNPSPFYQLGAREALTDWKFSLFTFFYRYLYAINLRRNDLVIVQQEWLRDEFRRRYQVPNIVVAHPRIPSLVIPALHEEQQPEGQAVRFFYPTYPRSFKNVELLLQAARILEQAGVDGFTVWLTIDGTENRYAAKLRSQYGALRSVSWLGIMPRDRILLLYAKADCLLFPSKLETWGMPISEFQQTGKPMLVIDLPYAHETVGTYNAVKFFPPGTPRVLADAMESFVQGRLAFSQTSAPSIPAPFAADWTELFHILLHEERGAHLRPMNADSPAAGSVGASS